MADPSGDAAIDPVLSAYVEAAAGLLGLHLRPAERESVEAHFARLAAMARQVEALALDLGDEPAPLFHPGGR